MIWRYSIRADHFGPGNNPDTTVAV
jgi:hypothetical protein